MVHGQHQSVARSICPFAHWNLITLGDFCNRLSPLSSSSQACKTGMLGLFLRVGGLGASLTLFSALVPEFYPPPSTQLSGRRA
jgi:hypothetical protein